MTGQACFIDLEKAFDAVDDEVFLEKVGNYGFRRKIKELLRRLRSDIELFVSKNNLESQRFRLRQGFENVMSWAHYFL